MTSKSPQPGLNIIAMARGKNSSGISLKDQGIKVKKVFSKEPEWARRKKSEEEAPEWVKKVQDQSKRQESEKKDIPEWAQKAKEKADRNRAIS